LATSTGEVLSSAGGDGALVAAVANVEIRLRGVETYLACAAAGHFGKWVDLGAIELENRRFFRSGID
jgi:hypothetical protein